MVAGGRLDIQGLNETCLTWVNLLDVGRDVQVVPEVYPIILVPLPSCNHSVIDKFFESGVGHSKLSLGCKDSIDIDGNLEQKGSNYFRTCTR